MQDFWDTDSCDCNTHQEHVLELTNDQSDFPLPLYENLLTDDSGNCIICDLKLSSPNCKGQHECSCPRDASIILESCLPIYKTPVLKKKKIGPNPVGNLNAIVNLTEIEAQKNLAESEAKKQALPLPLEFIDIESISSASLYGPSKHEDISSLLENAGTFEFTTEMTERAINELIEKNNNPTWRIDYMLQTMTDKTDRIAKWIAGTKSNYSGRSIPSPVTVSDSEVEFPECVAYSVESSPNPDSSLPEVILSDTSELCEIKSAYTSTPESPTIFDQEDFYIRKRIYESTPDEDCSIFEEKKAKTSP